MREIQDMTLNLSRGLEAINSRLLERSECFPNEFRRLKTPNDAFGIRITAIPIGGEIRLSRVFQKGKIVNGLEMIWHQIELKGKTQTSMLKYPNTFLNLHWKPTLRAARADPSDGMSTNVPFHCYQEIHCDGLIELGFVSCKLLDTWRDRQILFPSWPIALFANMAAWADRIRNNSNAPAVEYAIEVEMYAVGETPVEISDLDEPPIGTLQVGATIFPRYSLGNYDEIPILLSLLNRDIWHHFGKDISDEENLIGIRGS